MAAGVIGEYADLLAARTAARDLAQEVSRA